MTDDDDDDASRPKHQPRVYIIDEQVRDFLKPAGFNLNSDDRAEASGKEFSRIIGWVRELIRRSDTKEANRQKFFGGLWLQIAGFILTGILVAMGSGLIKAINWPWLTKLFGHTP